MRRLDEPNAYGWNPPNAVPGEPVVPEDLVPHYREFEPGYWGYICPCCHCVWAPGWGSDIPAQFRAHIRPYLDGRDCFFGRWGPGLG